MRVSNAFERSIEMAARSHVKMLIKKHKYFVVRTTRDETLILYDSTAHL